MVEERRADEEERRSPAFWSVFCRVISLDSAESSGGVAVAVVKRGLVGESA